MTDPIKQALEALSSIEIQGPDADKLYWLAFKGATAHGAVSIGTAVRIVARAAVEFEQQRVAAIAALEGLEKAEPFGTVTVVKREGCVDMHWFYRWPEPPYIDNAAEVHRVYTHPAPVQAEPAPQVVGLTDTEIAQVFRKEFDTIGSMAFAIRAARAIEAAHGINQPEKGGAGV